MYMADRNNNILGIRIKKARLAKGYTQSKLAEGICTQAQISNIEKGTNNDNPSSHTLFLLSEKLGTSMSYLYGQDQAFHGDSHDIQFNEIRDIIKRVKARRDYETLSYIIKNELENLNNVDDFFEQYLMWHQSLVIHYLDEDYEKSESMIKDALAINTGQDNLESKIQLIRIKMSLSNYYERQNRDNEAKALLDECFEEYEAIVNYHNMNFELLELYNHLVLNLSNIYFNQKKYEKIIEIVNKAIDQSHKYQSMVSLGEYYYQLALANKRMNHLELYFVNIEKALTIFDLQRNDTMFVFVSKKLDETKNELKYMSK